MNNRQLWGIVASNGERFQIYATLLELVGDFVLLFDERTGETSANEAHAIFFRPTSVCLIEQETIN